MSTPSPDPVRIAVYLTPSIRERLKILAVRRNIPMTDIVSRLIERELAAAEQETTK